MEDLLDLSENVPNLVSVDGDCAGTCMVSGCDKHFMLLSVWMAVPGSVSGTLQPAAAQCQGEAYI